MVKFNLNDYVYIQILSEGWVHLHKTVGKEYIQNCILCQAVKIEGEVWYKLQMHEVLTLFKFDKHYPPYRANIMFDELDLEKV